MVNSTELVREVLNAQLEFNAKIIFFIILFVYLLWMLWYSYKIVPEISKYDKVMLSELLIAAYLRIISVIFLFFYPLYTLVFMFQGVALELIMRYLFIAYGITTTLIALFVMIFGFEKFLKLFGVDLFKQGSMKKDVRRGRK